MMSHLIFDAQLFKYSTGEMQFYMRWMQCNEMKWKVSNADVTEYAWNVRVSCLCFCWTLCQFKIIRFGFMFHCNISISTGAEKGNRISVKCLINSIWVIKILVFLTYSTGNMKSDNDCDCDDDCECTLYYFVLHFNPNKDGMRATITMKNMNEGSLIHYNFDSTFHKAMAITSFSRFAYVHCLTRQFFSFGTAKKKKKK